MLDGDVTDLVEARSLSFRPQYIDIYLASWGPEDDGATLEGPGPLTLLALQKGIKMVRKSLCIKGEERAYCLCVCHLCLLPHSISGPAWEGVSFCLGVRERGAKRRPLLL